MSEGRTVASVANEYGIHENTIYKWQRQFEMDPEHAFTQQSQQDRNDDVIRLKRRVKELELEVEFLKKSGGVLRERPAVKYAWIDKNAVPGLSMRTMCRLLKVRRQGYYEYHKRGESQREYRDRLLTQKVKNVFYENRRIYGARRIAAELARQGTPTDRKQVRRIMLLEGLIPVTCRRQVNTTNSNHHLGAFPNLLKSGKALNGLNQAWASDMTYVRTDEGWLYLCTVLDLHSRRVVGYATSKRIDRHLAIAAFSNALENRHPNKGCIFHTDRGCQYASSDFRMTVIAAGSIQSMSAAGNPYDNAYAEAFFRALKVEWLDNRRFDTRQQAVQAIASYLLYYNRKRLHSSLGYLSPVDFEMSLMNQPLAS